MTATRQQPVIVGGLHHDPFDPQVDQSSGQTAGFRGIDHAGVTKLETSDLRGWVIGQRLHRWPNHSIGLNTLISRVKMRRPPSSKLPQRTPVYDDTPQTSVLPSDTSFSSSPVPASPASTTRGRRHGAVWIVAVLLVVNCGALGYSIVQERQSEARITELTADLGQQATTISTLRTDLGTVRQRVAGAEAAAKAAGNDATSAKDSASKANNEAAKASKAQQEAQAAALDPKSVSAKAMPSIVTVHCGTALGSGFAIKAQLPSGYQTAILTNEHVVDECTLVGGPDAYASQGSTTFAGTLGEYDGYNDLAILYIKPRLSPLEVGASAAVGDPVAAIGPPTVSRGR